MNKIEYINLGGNPLAIDLDAYKKLKLYIASLKSYFGASEYADEIVQDIEVRLSELIHESMKGRKIANIKDVEYSINIMGLPEQFDSPEHEQSQEHSSESDKTTFKEKDKKYDKKLFRDPENKILGGVCSGLAAYFNIDDPIWVRLTFVVFTLTGGAGVLIYIIMWIIMPKAKTSIDRLRMKGNPINFQNIENMVEDSIDHISGFADRVYDKFKK